jgi:hypothetical protein
MLADLPLLSLNGLGYGWTDSAWTWAGAAATCAAAVIAVLARKGK